MRRSGYVRVTRSCSGVEGNRAVLAKTADVLSLAGSVPVPAARRNVAWDDVIRTTRSSAAIPSPVSAFVDTNILVRHLTGDPPDMAAPATAYLRSAPELLLTDLVVAETVNVLESF